jgi:hypothetical protein
VSSLVTLLEARNLAKLYANQRSTAFLTNDEWDVLINAAGSEFYDLLVAAMGHEFFEKPATLATTSGSAIVALPADFYELITVFANWGAQQREELNDLGHLGDSADFQNWNQWAYLSPKAWRIRGALLEFFPTPSAVTTLEIRYIPPWPKLVGDAATFDAVNGWHKLVAARAAEEALGLQAMPSQFASGICERERERIEAMAADRATANAPTIRDVKFRGRNYWDNRWRLPPPP